MHGYKWPINCTRTRTVETAAAGGVAKRGGHRSRSQLPPSPELPSPAPSKHAQFDLGTPEGRQDDTSPPSQKASAQNAAIKASTHVEAGFHGQENEVGKEGQDAGGPFSSRVVLGDESTSLSPTVGPAGAVTGSKRRTTGAFPDNR